MLKKILKLDYVKYTSLYLDIIVESLKILSNEFYILSIGEI